jgi:hypothetical protein
MSLDTARTSACATVGQRNSVGGAKSKRPRAKDKELRAKGQLPIADYLLSQCSGPVVSQGT